MGQFLAPLLAAAITGFLSWYANRSTSKFFYGRLTQQVEDNTRRIGTLETDSKDYQQRISHLEGARPNGTARFQA